MTQEQWRALSKRATAQNLQAMDACNDEARPMQVYDAASLRAVLYETFGPDCAPAYCGNCGYDWLQCTCTADDLT